MAAAKANFWAKMREASKKNQRTAADEIGVTPSAVWSWEKGRSTPGLRLVQRIAKVYGVPQQKIIDELVRVDAGVQR